MRTKEQRKEDIKGIRKSYAEGTCFDGCAGFYDPGMCEDCEIAKRTHGKKDQGETKCRQ